MSYILDALKKTDQERQRGTTPSLGSQPPKGPPQRPKGPAWLYLLLAVLLINAGVLCWWLKPWQREPADNRSVTETEKKDQLALPPFSATAASKGGKSVNSSVPKSLPQASEAIVPAFPGKGLLGGGTQGKAKEVTPERVTADKAIKPAQGKITRSRLESKSELPATMGHQQANSMAVDPRRRRIMPGQAGNSVSLADAGSDVNGVLIQKYKGNVPVRAFPKFVQPKETAAKAETGKQRSDNSAVEESQSVRQPSAEYSGVNEKVEVIGNVLLDYNQLPFSLRQQLPPLNISLHLYADKPERRMANIDGQMRHEKERIDKNLVIEKITPDGVIFDYAGRRFLKKVFR